MTDQPSLTADNSDRLEAAPHSRACGHRPHDHGRACHANCPTCGGRPLPDSAATNRWDGVPLWEANVTDQEIAEAILADINYKLMKYERAVIVTAHHVQRIREAARRA